MQWRVCGGWFSWGRECVAVLPLWPCSTTRITPHLVRGCRWRSVMRSGRCSHTLRGLRRHVGGRLRGPCPCHRDRGIHKRIVVTAKDRGIHKRIAVTINGDGVSNWGCRRHGRLLHDWDPAQGWGVCEHLGGTRWRLGLRFRGPAHRRGILLEGQMRCPCHEHEPQAADASLLIQCDFNTHLTGILHKGFCGCEIAFGFSKLFANAMVKQNEEYTARQNVAYCLFGGGSD